MMNPYFYIAHRVFLSPTQVLGGLGVLGWAVVHVRLLVWRKIMATEYQHRIGVRAEIYFSLALETLNPSSEQLRLAVITALSKAVDEENGFDLKALPDGRVHPAWNDINRNPDPADVGAVISYECFEIQKPRLTSRIK